MNDDTLLKREHDACVRLGELSKLFGTAEDVVAQSVRKAPAMLPHHIARLDDILTQMRHQARRLRACQLGLRLVRGGLSP